MNSSGSKTKKSLLNKKLLHKFKTSVPAIKIPQIISEELLSQGFGQYLKSKKTNRSKFKSREDIGFASKKNTSRSIKRTNTNQNIQKTSRNKKDIKLQLNKSDFSSLKGNCYTKN